MSATTTTPLVLTVPRPLTEHPAAVYISSLAPGSEETMRQSLNFIAGLLTNGEADYLTLDWAALRYKNTAAIRSALGKKYQPVTANKMLSALRRVLKEALRLDLMSPVDYAKAVDLESFKARSTLRGRALTQKEIDSLMSVCFSDRTLTGYRDAAIIALLRATGIRRSELVNLNMKDCNLASGEVKIQRGKGGVDRTVYLPDSVSTIIKQWVEIRNNAPGSLFCKINKSGRVIQGKLTPQAIRVILQKRGVEAGIEPFSPHDLRRTFVSDLLDAGHDLVTVQQLAGHTNPTLTARYDRRGEERKRRAVKSLEVPTR
ncbi:MAG: tyrosine-type recombinase/integrase [Rhizonema sp. NSF051]|nr:tyrosine-type recombinase/integrase [Rhizonema sp. NSF051]